MWFIRKNLILKKVTDENKNMNISRACKYISTGRLQNNVSSNNSEISLMKNA